MYISIAGSIGKVGVIPEQLHGANLTENAAKITDLSCIYNKFICYALASGLGQGQINDLIVSSNQPKLALFRIEKINIPISPLPEQHRIVSKIEELFTSLDAGVENLKKVQAQLKRYRQSVLKAAVEGKLTAEWREKRKDELEPASELLKRILQERREKWESEQLAKYEANGKKPPENWRNKYKEPKPPDTRGLPELPERWVYTTIEAISDTIHYGYTASASNQKIGPHLLRITDIQNAKVNWESVPYCEIDDAVIYKYLLKPNDLVFARTGATVGKSFLIKDGVPKAVFASYLIERSGSFPD